MVLSYSVGEGGVTRLLEALITVIYGRQDLFLLLKTTYKMCRSEFPRSLTSCISRFDMAHQT
jgi:hypothetical protein